MQNKNVKLLVENWRSFLTEEEQPDPETAKKLDAVIKKPYQAFVGDLSKLAADPRVQAVLNYGLKDGDPDDEKVKAQNMTPSVASLRPTQNEIDMNGSLKWAIKSTKSFLNLISPGPKKLGNAIVTGAGGKLVLDGHHRWSQLYCLNPEGQIVAVDLTIPEAGPETYLKVMQLAIASDLKQVPTQSVKGRNLLDSSITEQDIIDYVLKSAGRDLLMAAGDPKSKVYKFLQQKVGGGQNALQEQDASHVKHVKGVHGKGASLLGKFIYSNIEKMRKTSQAVPGAPPRDFMPQTDDAKNWQSKAQSGEINFKNTAAIAQTAQAPVKESLKIKITKRG